MKESLTHFYLKNSLMMTSVHKQQNCWGVQIATHSYKCWWESVHLHLLFKTVSLQFGHGGNAGSKFSLKMSETGLKTSSASVKTKANSMANSRIITFIVWSLKDCRRLKWNWKNLDDFRNRLSFENNNCNWWRRLFRYNRLLSSKLVKDKILGK